MNRSKNNYYMPTKICTLCRRRVPIDLFPARKTGRDGKHSACKACIYTRYILPKKPPTFYRTVVTSPQWIAWRDHAHEYNFDWAESTECAWLSPEHFQAFISFVKTL